LTRSSVAQPAIFVVSAAAWLALQLRRPGLKVAAAAGLSSGEWAALYAAGVLSFEDSLRVLEARGRFMQDACEEHAGGMLSLIGLDLAGAEKLARDSGVEVANLNSPEQTVLSGSREGIDRAEAGAKMAGAKKAFDSTWPGRFIPL
jgi:[acyl-carrier-protein] S-malonyltransferase